MLLHGLAVGPWHDESGTAAALRTHRAEEISVGIALILGLARAGACLGPLIDLGILLSHPYLILEPHFRRAARLECTHDRMSQLGEVFLYVATASAFWA